MKSAWALSRRVERATEGVLIFIGFSLRSLGAFAPLR